MLSRLPKPGLWLRYVRVGIGLSLVAGCAALSVEWWSGMAYLWGLQGSLGRGSWPVLFALWGLFLVLTLPLGLWASSPVNKHIWSLGWRAYMGVLLACGVAALSWLSSYYMGRATPAVVGITDEKLAAALSSLRGIARRLPKGSEPAPSLLTIERVQCAEAPSGAGVTLVATFVARAAPAHPISRCFQHPSLKGAVSALRAALLEGARRGPVKIDLVTGWQRLSRRHAWLDALKLRPGLDGVCSEADCVMPWQLLAHGAFSTHRPVHFIPDLQFGAAPDQLRQAVGAGAGSDLAGLLRLTTSSYVLDLAQRKAPLTPLVRMRRRHLDVTSKVLERAARDAEAYVLSAQLPDGKFRYTLDPMSGAADTQSFNLARQAGTTLVLCELGAARVEVERAIEKGLLAFRDFERHSGDLLALTHDAAASLARLSESALPLVSLLGCGRRVGASTEASVAGLSKFVLELQRDDGGFAPALDLHTGQVQPGPEPLYAAGQAVLGLVLLEQRQQAHPSPVLPPHEIVHAAVERAMEFFATEYWSHPLTDFFFLEENWHCLAARAALGVHRHPGYEKFCLDYVSFKSRLILEREQGIDADFDGGFGFGNVVPPHNTGAAGFGEALAAALAVRRAQGRPDPAGEQLLARVLGFLLRQQWSRDNCFACATPLVIGGMSEHTHSALTRIDFAQHAWAALGHGGGVLGLLTRAETR